MQFAQWETEGPGLSDWKSVQMTSTKKRLFVASRPAEVGVRDGHVNEGTVKSVGLSNAVSVQQTQEDLRS